MNIHQQVVIFFVKTMKVYSKTVILSLKIYEKILKSNFIMEEGGIKHIDCVCIYFEAVSYRCRGVVIL